MIRTHLAGLLAEAAERVTPAPPAPLVIERARDARFGDYATNWPLRLAGPVGRPPLALAEAIAVAVRPDSALSTVEAAAPGYLNMRLADAWILDRLAEWLSTDLNLLGTLDRIKAMGLPADTYHEPACATEETLANPAFLLRHTPAWLASLERLAVQEGVAAPAGPGAWASRTALDLEDADTRALALAILDFPDELARAEERHEPRLLLRYAEALCRTVHGFYAHHRIFSEAPLIAQARMGMMQGTLLVLRPVMVHMLGWRALQNF